MSRPCMTDPYEECFEDCPNCIRAMYKDKLDDDYNANFNDDDDREDDEEWV